MIPQSKNPTLSTNRFRKLFYARFLQPKSLNFLDHRRELLVNIFLASLTVIALIAMITASEHHLTSHQDTEPSSLLTNLLFMLASAGCLYASRRGKYKAAGYAIVGLLCFVTLIMTISYSYELPIVALLYALSVVVIGIMMSTRGALVATFTLSALMLTIAYLQVTAHMHPDVSWRKLGFQTGDAIGFVAILSLIGVITWLANREIDHAITQSLVSKQALQHERDNLELKVQERTRQLEESQLVRIMQLQRFAEFGQLNANLLHDIANPLTAASINLEQAHKRKPMAIKMAQANLKHLERYLNAARQQLNAEHVDTIFSVNGEIDQIRPMLAAVAKPKGVQIKYIITQDLAINGNPVKFSQMLSNLIANAIDAYDDSKEPKPNLVVFVSMVAKNKQLLLTVRDHGVGISPPHIGKIFEPFYTTKGDSSRGMGIGLAMVKQYVETDFGGTISVSCNATAGTVFSVTIPLAT